MKHLLLTTIATVLLMGCGESQQSVPPAETEPAEPVAEAAKPELPTAKVPYISIHFATAEGNIKAVIRHLANGVDVNVKNDFGFTPLLKVAQFGRRVVAELLIAKGADVSVKDKFGRTPLHCAVDEGQTEVAELLIAAGADVNGRDNGDRTPLDFAVMKKQNEIAELLIANGAYVNAKDDEGWTTLHWAVMAGYKEVAELLIAKGADMNAKNDEGRTPLDEAVEWDKPEIADLLRKHGGKTKKELEAVATKSSDICSTSPPRQSRARRLIGVGRLSVVCYRLPLSGL